jgi:hypothetical protein
MYFQTVLRRLIRSPCNKATSPAISACYSSASQISSTSSKKGKFYVVTNEEPMMTFDAITDRAATTIFWTELFRGMQFMTFIHFIQYCIAFYLSSRIIQDYKCAFSGAGVTLAHVFKEVGCVKLCQTKICRI